LAAEIAEQLDVERGSTNALSGSEANTPFGGVKRSDLSYLVPLASLEF
jgi:succinate-semialdehyde dehydrogenase/glutarate-semialdehyde dehydrogenase